MKIEWKGTENLAKKLRSNAELKIAKQIVKTNGSELDKRMKARAVFRGHYEGKKFVKPTGATKRSIKTTISDGGLTSTTQPSTEYASYVEYGTRKMQAQPFVRPAFEVQKELFKKDMDRLT